MGIPLADHVIVGDNQYFSFREKQILPMDMVRYSDNLADIKIGKVAEEKCSVVGRLQKLQSEVDKSTAVKKSKSIETSLE